MLGTRRLNRLAVVSLLILSGCASPASSSPASVLPSSSPAALETMPSSSSRPDGAPLKWPFEVRSDVGDPSGRSAAGTFVYLAVGRYRATLTAYHPTPWLPTPVPKFVCTASGKVAPKATPTQTLWEARVSYDPAADPGDPSSGEFTVQAGAQFFVSFAFGCPFILAIDRLP